MNKDRYILAVLDTYRPAGAPGGTGGTLSNGLLLRSMSALVPVRVLTFDGFEFRAPASMVDERLTLHSWPSPLWRHLELVWNWIPFVRSEVRTFVQRFGKPEAVLASGSMLAALDPVVTGGASGLGIVRAFENFGPLAPLGIETSHRVALAKQALVRRFRDASYLRRAAVVGTNSRFMADQIARKMKIARERIWVVPQLCDVQPVVPFGAAPPRTLGFVNRSADKNLALVIKLAERGPDLEFKVFGVEPSKTMAFPRNVRVMGWQSDRNQMFSQAALWLVPSKWPEPFGRVSMEAQAADRPVLVADVGGLPETVVDQRYLLSGYDPDKWMIRIRELLELPSSTVSDNGARLRARHSTESHDRVVAQLVDRLLGRRSELREGPFIEAVA